MKSILSALQSSPFDKTQAYVLKIGSLLCSLKYDAFYFHFHWAPRHMGIHENTTADNIVSCRPLYINDRFLIAADLRAIDSKYSVFSWQQWWNNSIQGHHSHSLFP